MKRHIILIGALVTLHCLIAGCTNHYQQREWHENLRTARFVVSRLADHNVPLLLEEQLLAIVGYRPDLKVHPL